MPTRDTVRTHVKYWVINLFHFNAENVYISGHMLEICRKNVPVSSI